MESATGAFFTHEAKERRGYCLNPIAIPQILRRKELK